MIFTMEELAMISIAINEKIEKSEKEGKRVGVSLDTADTLVTSHGMVAIENMLLKDIVKDQLDMSDDDLEDYLNRRAKEETDKLKDVETEILEKIEKLLF